MKIKDILKKIRIIKITILTALLGAYGGQGKKEYRRIWIPAVLTALAILHLRHWLPIFVMSMAGAFSMGYGIPCPSDPDPSSLGKFWYNFFSLVHWNKRKLLANIFTRGTIGFIVALSLICIPIIKLNWIIYLVGSSIIIFMYSLISWRDLGVIKTKTGHLLIVDLIVYGVIGLIASIIIYF